MDGHPRERHLGHRPFVSPLSLNLISIVVPEPGEDRTAASPPSILARSIIPINPNPPFRLASSVSKPLPLSRTTRWSNPSERVIRTAAALAPECLTILLMVS